MACALAVGALSADEVDGARSHLTSCGHCTRELETLQEVVDALVAWPTDVLRPRDAVWWRVLERVGAPASVGPPHARGPAWRSVAPGISCCVLTADTETQCVGMLVRLTPGGAYPPHVHASVEELYLLSGELWIDEEKVHPGDYHRSEPGTRDHRVWSETGCTCVLITSTRDALGAP
jgi:quercetin dioxygenase-like cupin family protein